MRLLVISAFYPPETGPAATRMKYVTEGLAAMRHEVSIIAGLPNYPTGVVPPEYRGKLIKRDVLPNGIRIARVYQFARPQRRFYQRILGELTLSVSFLISGLLARPRPDVILTSSPPFICVLPVALVSMIRRIPFVLEVRDLYPDSVIALGAIPKPLIPPLKWMERFFYRRASRVIGVTRGVCGGIQSAAGSRKTTCLVRYGVDKDFFQPRPADAVLLDEYRLRGKFVVLYVGGMVLGGGMETVIDAANLLRNRDDIAFVLVGDGTKKKSLVEKATGLLLDNVIFVPQQPRDTVARFMSIGNVAILPMDDFAICHGSLPTKLFEYMSSGLPVIISGRGESVEVLEDAGAGVPVEPNDPEALAAAIVRMKDAPDRREEYGRNAREYVIEKFTFDIMVRHYEDILASVCGKTSDS